jgi:hypothetical protein
MAYFRTIPTLGLKTDVPIDDFSLFKFVGDRTAVVYDTGGENVDYQRKRNSCTKAYGIELWNHSAATGVGYPNFLYELDDGTNLDYIFITSQTMNYYDSSKDPVAVQAGGYIDYSSLASGPVAVGETVTGDTTATVGIVAGPISDAAGECYISSVSGGTGDFSATESLTFSGGATANCDSTLQTETLNSTLGQAYNGITYGSYLIFTDFGHTTPKKWKHGDAGYSNLINAENATLYKFRYIEEWYLHIIGLYSDQANGDVDIRWTEALPGTSVSFPSANQIYKPGRDSISGVSKLGANNVLVYGTDSISKLDYYPNSTPAFGITPLLEGQGTPCNSSIVNAYGFNWFFNKNHGFVRYSGGSRILPDDVISRDIEDVIENIDSRYYNAIEGLSLPRNRQVVWSVPQGATMYGTTLLVYDVDKNMWSRTENANYKIDAWTREAGEYKQMVMSYAQTNIVAVKNEVSSGSPALDAYRIEPAMHFGDPKKKKFLRSIWFGIVQGGDYYLDVYHRGGDTVKEIAAASWQWIGSLSLNNPDPPAVYMPSNTFYVNYDNLAGGNFAIGETVTGQTGETTAEILYLRRSSAVAGTLYFRELSGGDGGFDDDEQLDNGSGVTADCVGTDATSAITASARYHQIKWGTDESNEKYSVNWVEYDFEMGGEY